MSKVLCFGSVIAATVALCAPAQADPFFTFQQPPVQSEALPQDQLPPEAAAPDAADENAALPERLQRQIVDYQTREAPGTIIVDTPHTYLYYVLGNGKAVRYGIGVGREGFTWSGVKTVARKTEWPDWYPPTEMLERQPYLPRMMAGGPGNPLGARAMYLGSSEYRIHGTNDPTTIGKNVSSGCIRLTNDNVIDLYNRVQVGAKVVVLPQSAAPTHEAKAPAQDWQTRAQSAIDRARRTEPQHTSLSAQGRRMSWNEGPRARLN